ncbi:MAG: CHASE2 domain-containing protein [Candidatus Binataceae bacterium]
MASRTGSTSWTRAIKTIVWGLAAVALITFYYTRHPAFLEFLELRSADVRLYSLRKPSPPTGYVVIAAVDDRSIAELGRWPWPRSTMARLVSALRDYKVSVVGFDMIFSERDPEDVERETIAKQLRDAGISAGAIGRTLGSSNDRAFAEALKEQGSAYLAYAFNSHQITETGRIDLTGYRTRFLEPPPVAYNLVRKAAGAPPRLMHGRAYLPPTASLNRAAAGVGYVDINADGDGLMRAYPTVIEFNGRYCVPLFMAVVDDFAHHAPLSLDLGPGGVTRVAVGDFDVPVDELGQMMVHFRGAPGAIARYSITDIIHHRVPANDLEGKIVFAGVTGHGLGDRFVTPVGGDFPGVEIQASAADTVLRGDIIRRSEEMAKVEELAGVMLGVAITVAAAFMSAMMSLAIAGLLGAGYFLYATFMLVHEETLIGIVFPLLMLVATYLVVVIYRYINEGLEKRYLRLAFEHYLNPDVIASVVDDPAGLKLGGERRHLSILFSDIVNFTARAERSDPEPLVALLNTYMTAMINVIFETGGVVDKLMGDGIMAFWGAPLGVENGARNAIECALRMFAELDRLREHDERFKDVDIGIGISTGEAVVGNFGGDRHFDYSVIGDIVNLASRLEGLTRQFKVRVLVNRETFVEAGGAYVAREIGLVKVKGKDQLVPVVEIAAREGDGADPAYYQRFTAALDLLHRGYSPEGDLRTLLRERPADQVVTMCLERLKTSDGRPAREMVFEFDSK